MVARRTSQTLKMAAIAVLLASVMTSPREARADEVRTATTSQSAPVDFSTLTSSDALSLLRSWADQIEGEKELLRREEERNRETLQELHEERRAAAARIEDLARAQGIVLDEQERLEGTLEKLDLQANKISKAIENLVEFIRLGCALTSSSAHSPALALGSSANPEHRCWQGMPSHRL